MHVCIEIYDNQPYLYCCFCYNLINSTFYKVMFEDAPFNLHPQCFKDLKLQINDVIKYTEEK